MPPPHRPEPPLRVAMTNLLMLCGLSMSFFLAWHSGYRQILMPDHATAPKGWYCRFNIELPDGSESHFTLEVKPEWAPIAAERFGDLVDMQFYDETRFHYVWHTSVQFGVSPVSEVALTWRDHRHIMDEPLRRSNNKRTVSLAPWGANERPNPVEKNMRSTLLSINRKHNKKFDHYKYTPFAVVVEGYDELDKLCARPASRARGSRTAPPPNPVSPPPRRRRLRPGGPPVQHAPQGRGDARLRVPPPLPRHLHAAGQEARRRRALSAATQVPRKPTSPPLLFFIRSFDTSH